MFALIVFSLITSLILYNIYYRLQPEIRPIFSKYLTFIFFLGSISIILYTADNLINHNQVDMEGDAQYYYYGAKEYLETGEINVLYPYYIKFISLFLQYGDAVTIRFAHLLLFMLIYSIGALILNDFGISKKGFKYYSIFTGLNGAFYGTLTPIVRDTFYLFHVALAIFLISRLLLLYDLGKLTYRKLILYSVPLFFVGYGIYELQFVSLFLILGAFIISWSIIVVLLLKGNIFRKVGLMFFIFCISVVLVKYLLPTESFLHGYEATMIDKLRIEEQMALTGGRGVEDNPLFAFMRFILGPGLIRPLFPEKYFLVYTTMFAAFNWWGAVFWYLNLLITVPKLIRNPLLFLRIPSALFILVFTIEFALMYALTAGGPGGLRKRVVVYFFYTIFIAMTFYTPHVSEKIKKLKVVYKGIKLPYEILMALLLIVFLFIHIRGLS